MLQRKPSLTISKTDTMDNDTFEHILQITSQQDTIMAYYYLDENNKVKVTEIFDLTDAESSIVQTKEEKHLNNGLQFDDEWDDSSFCGQHADDRKLQYHTRFTFNNTLFLQWALNIPWKMFWKATLVTCSRIQNPNGRPLVKWKNRTTICTRKIRPTI